MIDEYILLKMHKYYIESHIKHFVIYVFRRTSNANNIKKSCKCKVKCHSQVNFPKTLCNQIIRMAAGGII